MSHPLNRDQAEIDRKREAAAAALRLSQLKSDFQWMFDQPHVRRAFALFFDANGLDDDPFNPNAMTQSMAIGRQNACRWWINAIRTYCPEREAQIRKEAQAADNEARALAAQRNEEQES
jgi:hypothetical protein